MSSNNLILEVAPTPSYYCSNVAQDDGVIRCTDSNRALQFCTTCNAAYAPLTVTSSNCVIPNLSNASVQYSSNTLGSWQSSNFSMTWGGGILLPVNGYVYQTNQSFNTGLSYCPNVDMSNLRTASYSNGFLLPKIKGLYTFDYTIAYVNRTGLQQAWFQHSNAVTSYGRAASSASNPIVLTGSFTTVCYPGDQIQRVLYNACTVSNNTDWWSTTTMTLHHPLP